MCFAYYGYARYGAGSVKSMLEVAEKLQACLPRLRVKLEISIASSVMTAFKFFSGAKDGK